MNVVSRISKEILVNSFVLVVRVLRDARLLRYDTSNIPDSLVLVNILPLENLELNLATTFLFLANACHNEHVLNQKVNSLRLLRIKVFHVVQVLNLSVKIKTVFLVLLFIHVCNHTIGKADLRSQIDVVLQTSNCGRVVVNLEDPERMELLPSYVLLN